MIFEEKYLSCYILLTDQIGTIHNGWPHLGGRRVSQKQTTADKGGKKVSQIWTYTLKKKKIFIFFIIIWKYFLSNVNLIFEYSVLDKIMLDCKVFPPPHTFYINYQLRERTLSM